MMLDCLASYITEYVLQFSFFSSTIFQESMNVPFDSAIIISMDPIVKAIILIHELKTCKKGWTGHHYAKIDKEILGTIILDEFKQSSEY